MSVEQQRVIRQCIETEIAATEIDLDARPPRRSEIDGKPLAVPDIRAQHLSLLREALYEVNRMKVAGTSG